MNTQKHDIIVFERMLDAARDAALWAEELSGAELEVRHHPDSQVRPFVVRAQTMRFLQESPRNAEFLLPLFLSVGAGSEREDSS